MTRFTLFLLLIHPVFGQLTQGQPPAVPPVPGTESDVKLPNGKSQHAEIVKADYKRNLEDATQLAKLADEVKADLEKDEQYVVSVKTLKKLDEIEKLAKAMKSRLKRY